MDLFKLYLLFYGVLALSHIAAQMLMAHADHRRQRRRGPAPPHPPSVTVVVPAFNEEPRLLYQCVRSIDRQDYAGGIEAIVVDDGSRNREELLPVAEEFSAGRFRVLLGAENAGKRHCQSVVFNEARGEVIVTVDSDTVLEPDAISTIVRKFADPGIGAVTGHVKVINAKENFLTRLISYRYWSAFNQERAAQSLLRVVMCASGPFSAYRRSIVDAVKERYVSQRFLGEACTFGDDRHLTNLVLELGYGVVYDEHAVAHTHVPNTLRKYLRQQVRWNKSFYREMLWTIRFAHRHHPYLMIDLLLQAILPFLLIGALLAMTYQAIFVNISHLWFYLAMIAAIGLLRASYGLFRTRSPGFLSFMVYGFIHVGLLIPARLYALATIRRGHWGTRGEVEPVPEWVRLFSESAFERREFESRLQEELAMSTNGDGGAVLAMELGGVDDVRRAGGHRAAERLVHEVMAMLRDVVGRQAILARVATEELAVLLPRADIRHARYVADLLLSAVESLDAARDAGREPLTASVGISPLERSAASGHESLARAESALGHIRASGTGRVAVWDPRDWTGPAAEQARWAPVIRRALELQEFHLYGQPVRHLASGAIEQWELLLRLTHQDEVIPPMAFLPAAERFGLVGGVDRWVTGEALALAVRRTAEAAPIRLEVNLSAASVGDPDFLAEVSNQIEAAATHPWSLVFEVSEAVALRDVERTCEFATQARGMGCRFAIDNFGRGEGAEGGSDALLEAVAPDYVKIDGNLIRHLPHDAAGQQRVREIVALTRRLGQQTIAEFVGDQETLDMLSAIGVDYGQGFHIGEPRPISAIPAPTGGREPPDLAGAAAALERLPA